MVFGQLWNTNFNHLVLSLQVATQAWPGRKSMAKEKSPAPTAWIKVSPMSPQQIASWVWLSKANIYHKVNRFSGLTRSASQASRELCNLDDQELRFCPLVLLATGRILEELGLIPRKNAKHHQNRSPWTSMDCPRTLIDQHPRTRPWGTPTRPTPT